MTPAARLPLVLLVGAICLAAGGYAWAAAGASPLSTPLQGVSVRPGENAAVVTWRVNDVPAKVGVEYGIDGRYGVWAAPVEAVSSQSGQSVLTGLEPNTTYSFHVLAVSPLSRSEATGTFTTSGVPANPQAAIAQVTPSTATSVYFSQAPATPTVANFTVDGSPIFPRMVWRSCPYAYGESLAAGINLFFGTSCTTPAGQLSQLAGKAFSAIDVQDRGVSGPGLVGWHLPDEGDMSVGKADGEPRVHDPGLVTFLTLTDHFAPFMAPPWAGRGIYPGWFSRADVIGFDTYPIEARCRLDLIPTVFSLQQALVKMAGSKPTFQWIEAGPMEKCFKVDPTPDTVRAESWLSIAAGARGIGYFPGVWSDDIRAAITDIDSTITALAPALLDVPGVGIAGPSSPIRVGVRRHNGAVYVIAVNTSGKPVQGRIAAAGLGDRTLDVFGEGRTIDSQLSQIVDSFDPYGVHIYIAPPAGW